VSREAIRTRISLSILPFFSKSKIPEIPHIKLEHSLSDAENSTMPGGALPM
jgi:hypothetical protein